MSKTNTDTTKKHAVHFSSASGVWATPQPFFDALNEEFGFTLDAAANDENHKCARYFTSDDNALNPRYSIQ